MSLARTQASIVRYLDNGGLSLALETRGTEPRVLLFLHGWISSRRMFYEVVERLDLQAFTVHLLDFRGAGWVRSPKRRARSRRLRERRANGTRGH